MPTSLALDELMDFAVRTAERAGRITLEHFGGAAVELKPDGSELTAADLASEEFIRAAIGEAYPGDGIMGEEGSSVEGRTGRKWIVDPIDGTRSFASGVPLYGVLLALEVDGSPLLGCCHLPAITETLVAAKGAGAWHNGKAASVSSIDSIAEARVVTSGLEYWRDWATPEGREGWTRLVSRTRYTRTWGDCYGYVLVATGRAEILADPASGAYWDYAPMVPIISEAGGRVSTLRGAEVQAWSTILASNSRVHADAIAAWGVEAMGDEALQSDVVRIRRTG
jgi:histidinol-phosphatase